MPVSLVKIITLWPLINFSIHLLLQSLIPSSKHFETPADFVYSIFFACALLAQIYHVIGYCQLSIYKKRGKTPNSVELVKWAITFVVSIEYRTPEKCVPEVTLGSFLPSVGRPHPYPCEPSGNPLAPVVRRLDNAILWIKLYPVDNAIRFAITYAPDSGLSVG